MPDHKGPETDDIKRTNYHTSLVVRDFHSSILLYPQLTDDNIMHTAVDIGPGVSFIPSAK